MPTKDYSDSGMYFVTICVEGKVCLLGEICDKLMYPNACGKIVEESFQWMNRQYDYLNIDTWVVMPNHVHAIFDITNNAEDARRGGSRTALKPSSHIKPLGQLIGAFKTVSTKHINQLMQSDGNRFWQRDFYETIIHDEVHLYNVREYIKNNPKKWHTDEFNPLKR